jgi:hypothetical protein
MILAELPIAKVLQMKGGNLDRVAISLFVDELSGPTINPEAATKIADSPFESI